MSFKRVNFWELFTYYADGSVEPKARVRIGGVEFGPGVRFSKGVSFSGVDLFKFIGKDLQVEEEGSGDKKVTIIRGFYGGEIS